MKSYIKYGMALLCLISAMHTAKAQQAYSYNQFIKNPTPVNTAYSLISQQGVIDVLTHNQWTGIDGAPTTLFFNGSIPFRDINGSAGIVLIHDKITVEKQTTFSAFFAKAVQLSAKNYLGLSVSGGVDSFNGNYSQLSAVFS